MVADPLGKLYNKEAVIEFLLDRSSYGDGDQICGYVKGVKVSFGIKVVSLSIFFSCSRLLSAFRSASPPQDLLNLVLTPNPAAANPSPPSTSDFPPASFICPLTLKEMSGSLPFVALRTCGPRLL